MPKGLVIDEILLTVFVPSGQPDAVYRAIRRTVTGRRFRGRLERALHDVFGRSPSLREARFTVTR